MYGNMNTHWQNVRKECGKWPFTLNDVTSTGSPTSGTCATANTNLIENAFYIEKDGVTKGKIDLGFTNSQNTNLWSKVTA